MQYALIIGRRGTLARIGRSGQIRLGALKVAIVSLAVVLALIAWMAVLVVTDVDQEQQLRQAESRASNLALVFEEQIYRQILSIDQALRWVKLDWERDPAGFDLSSIPRRAGSLSDIISQLVLTNANGRVVASTRHDAMDADLSGRKFFAVHRGSDGVGFLTTGPFQLNGEWFLNVSRRLNRPGGVFSGVVVASYDLNALMRDMSQADLGPRGMIMLIGRDGLVRAISLRGVQDPGTDISNSALHKAMFNDGVSTWTGPSGTDKDLRIHAWRLIPGQDMTLVVGLDKAAALASSEVRRRQALLGATAVTLLVLILALAVGAMISAAAAREQGLAQDRAVLEAANLQLARARERADEKSLQLGMTLAGMSDGISMFDDKLRLVLWNEQCVTLLGVPPASLKAGMTMEAITREQALAGEFGPGDVQAHVASAMADIYRRESAPSFTRTRPNGMEIELRRTQLPDGGWVTLYSDITARKQAEDAQLRAREQAELAAQEKSRFVAIVSHEIRTPLNVALNSLGLLDQSTLTAAQRQLVESGLTAGESLLGLLNDILDLSRMQVGRMQLRPAPFMLRALLDSVVDLFRYQAEERGVEFSVHVGPGVPERLMTDSGRLRQAVMNLVNNAAKFAEPGPASIRVSLSTLDGEPVLRFAVRDCGPEIPDLDRARLFRPFSQLERQGSGGTGLGLAICQLLANLLGGQIGCDGIGDGGKEFWLTLPADVLNVPADWAPKASTKLMPDWLPRTRVLLVEDVPANQMIVATVLRREGHMVDVASSGLEALEKIASNAYDLVFLDIFMPGIDGLETVRRIRTMPGRARTMPVVALTANVSGLDRADYLAAGMDDLVPKPVERASLLAALARHVWAGRRGGPAAPPRVAETPLPVLIRRIDPIDPARMAAWRSGLPANVCDALFADCIRQLREMLPELRAAMRDRSKPALKRVTHTITGVAGNYGLAGLEAAVRALAAADPEGLDAEAQTQAVSEEIDRAEEAATQLPQAQAA